MSVSVSSFTTTGPCTCCKCACDLTIEMPETLYLRASIVVDAGEVTEKVCVLGYSTLTRGPARVWTGTPFLIPNVVSEWETVTPVLNCTADFPSVDGYSTGIVSGYPQGYSLALGSPNNLDPTSLISEDATVIEWAEHGVPLLNQPGTYVCDEPLLLTFARKATITDFCVDGFAVWYICGVRLGDVTGGTSSDLVNLSLRYEVSADVFSIDDNPAYISTEDVGGMDPAPRAFYAAYVAHPTDGGVYPTGSIDPSFSSSTFEAMRVFQYVGSSTWELVTGNHSSNGCHRYTLTNDGTVWQLDIDTGTFTAIFQSDGTDVAYEEILLYYVSSSVPLSVYPSLAAVDTSLTIGLTPGHYARTWAESTTFPGTTLDQHWPCQPAICQAMPIDIEVTIESDSLILDGLTFTARWANVVGVYHGAGSYAGVFSGWGAVVNAGGHGVFWGMYIDTDGTLKWTVFVLENSAPAAGYCDVNDFPYLGTGSSTDGATLAELVEDTSDRNCSPFVCESQTAVTVAVTAISGPPPSSYAIPIGTSIKCYVNEL